jgi:hypothetical protein
MYENIIEAIEKITQYWQENPPVTPEDKALLAKDIAQMHRTSTVIDMALSKNN